VDVLSETTFSVHRGHFHRHYQRRLGHADGGQRHALVWHVQWRPAHPADTAGQRPDSFS